MFSFGALLFGIGIGGLAILRMQNRWKASEQIAVEEVRELLQEEEQEVADNVIPFPER